MRNTKKRLKKETVYWDMAQSTTNKSFQTHSIFSEWSRGNYYNNKTTGLFYRGPWISFTWINQIYFIRFSLPVLSCLQPRREIRKSFVQWIGYMDEGPVCLRNPHHSAPHRRVSIPRIWGQSYAVSTHMMIIYSETLFFNVVIVKLTNIGLDCIKIEMVLHIEIIFPPRNLL